MNKFYLLSIVGVLILLFNSPTFAQDNSKSFDSYHKNIFVEGLGANLLVGVNYDMRLQCGRMDGIGFRAGVGYTPVKSYLYGFYDYKGTTLSFPLEVNYLFGKGKNYLLTGIGAIPMYSNLEGTDGEGVKTYRGFGYGATYLSIGYRLQPQMNGFMFQINWNPMILRGKGFDAKWLGISIGYGFILNSVIM